MEFPAPPRIHVLHVPGADSHRDDIVARLSDQADACIHTDPDRRGVMPTWLEALDCARHRDADLPWAVIVQDDADPLRGWQQHLERACTYSPAPILGLTHFGKFGEEPLRRGCPYALGDNLVWGGAIAYHRSIVPELYAWTSAVYAETGYVHDDWLVAAYAMRTGVGTALAARAIFGQPVKKSLLNHNTKVRTPSTTIESTDGPAWSSVPRGRAVRRSLPPQVLDISRYTLSRGEPT